MNLTTLGEVTKEVIGIKFYIGQLRRSTTADSSIPVPATKSHFYSQLDDDPISMTLRSTAFRLPAVTHVLSTTRKN